MSVLHLLNVDARHMTSVTRLLDPDFDARSPSIPSHSAVCQTYSERLPFSVIAQLNSRAQPAAVSCDLKIIEPLLWYENVPETLPVGIRWFLEAYAENTVGLEACLHSSATFVFPCQLLQPPQEKVVIFLRTYCKMLPSITGIQ